MLFARKVSLVRRSQQKQSLAHGVAGPHVKHSQLLMNQFGLTRFHPVSRIGEVFHLHYQQGNLASGKKSLFDSHRLGMEFAP